MSRKQKFLKGFDNLEHETLLVGVKLPGCLELETIINPRENFESKKAYYDNAYDDNLKLKTCPEIKIVEYEFY